MRGTFEFAFDQDSLGNFNAALDVIISKVGRGTKNGTKAACEELLKMSLEQVPRFTNTLANSAYYEISGTYKTGFKGTVGYGGNGDPINPITGESASSYMMAVHENLSAFHPIGNAKFLENPAREYAKENFPRTVFKYAQESLAGY
jgi:hypothetical protein